MDAFAARFSPRAGGRHPLLHRHRAGIYAGGNGHDAAAFDLSRAADLFAGRGAGGIDSFRGTGQPGVGSNAHQLKPDQPRAGAALRAGAGGLFAGGSACHPRSRGRSLVAAHCGVTGVGRALRFHHGFLLPGRHALGNPARAGGKSALDVGAEWRGIRPGQLYCHGHFHGNFDPGLRAHGRSLLCAGGNPVVRQREFRVCPRGDGRRRKTLRLRAESPIRKATKRTTPPYARQRLRGTTCPPGVNS